MYTLSGNPLSLDSLHDYYAAFDCHTFDKASLERTQRQHQTTTPDTITQATEYALSADDICAFTQAMIDSFIQDDTRDYSLLTLVARVDSDNDTVNQMAVALWIEHFRLLFAEEENPLALLCTFPEQCATPIQMSAALSVLFEREIDIHEILASGLLQDYATHNVDNMLDVEKTYQRVFSDEDERLKIISRVRLTGWAIDTETTSAHVISGKLREDAFDPYHVDIHKPNFAWESITKERLTTLIQMIGPDVMVQALTALDSQALSELSQHVEAILAEYTDDELAGLFQYISTQNSLKSHCLAALSERISEERAHSLLRNLDVSPWVLLSAKPTLIGQLTQDDLERITQPLTASSDEPSRPFITPHDINDAFIVASNTHCDTNLKNSIYLSIAEIYLNSTEKLALEDDIIDALRNSEIVQRWVQEKATPHNTQWDEVLLANVPTLLTHENSYQNILEIAQSLRTPIRRLKQLGLDDTPVPLNVDDLDALILFSSIEYFVSTDYTDERLQEQIESVLSLMQPLEKYYHESLAVKRMQAREQYHPRNISRLAAQEQEIEAEIVIAKARVLLMTACHRQNDICFAILLDAEKPYQAYVSALITPDNFIRSHATFTDAQLSKFLPYTQLELTRVITNGTELGNALRHLKETECSVLLDRFPEQLIGIITDGDQLGYALQYLNEAQCNILLTKLSGELNSIIFHGAQLGAALRHLNKIQCNALLDRLSADLGKIICSITRLLYALSFHHLNEAQSNTLLTKLSDRLSDMITNGHELGSTLRHLSETQCNALLDRLPADLVGIITDGYQLGNTLQLLSETEDILPEMFPTNIGETQCNTLLDRLPTDLSTIITDSKQLGYVLQHLNERQCNLLLERIKGQLPTLLPNNDYTGKHKDLVNQKLIKIRRYNGQLFDVQEEHCDTQGDVTRNPPASTSTELR